MIRTCFVRDSRGSYWLQVPADNVWGFALIADDGLTFPGGFGAAKEWEYVAAEDVPPEVRQRFAWLIATEADLLC
jgi:hypothetical protein